LQFARKDNSKRDLFSEQISSRLELDSASSCASSSTAQEKPIGPLLQQLETYVQDGMQKTGVPGVAVAVVYHDKVVYLKGFGVRKANHRAPVDENTVFQLASVSKPIASTVVAALVGEHELDWDDKIIDLDPEFKLSDPNVTEQVTIHDLLSHRSGLPTSAGDALEDLGFTRPEILHKVRLLPLPGTFRKTYQYSNFGYTEGAIAAAKQRARTVGDPRPRAAFRAPGDALYELSLLGLPKLRKQSGDPRL
jgi:CubicO group peptidase (beta-lactamase class C family)